MRETTLEILRCPFCGTRLSVVPNDALVRRGGVIESGVLGCECCAFPIVEGIAVMRADEATRDAMHQLEAGRPEEALSSLLELDTDRRTAFRELLTRVGATFHQMLAVLCEDAEAAYLAYRLADPTFVTIEALVQAICQQPQILAGRCLDLCGGAGHLARVLSNRRPAGGTTLADAAFWKLWLARRFTVPEGEMICCDANHPLPFARDAFSLVVLADAFPYIWHKRLLADEMMRLSPGNATIVMPHLHSARGENISAGDTLTPEAYRDLFAPRHPRLFSDERLFADLIDRGLVNLADDISPAALGSEPSLTLVASGIPEVFRRYDVPPATNVTGELRVNPLYRVERRGPSSILTLTFPTPAYEEEFGACRRYLPERVTVNADLSGVIRPETLGPEDDQLRRRRVIIDAPPDYY